MKEWHQHLRPGTRRKRALHPTRQDQPENVPSHPSCQPVHPAEKLGFNGNQKLRSLQMNDRMNRI
jgi:hypothetical protein